MPLGTMTISLTLFSAAACNRTGRLGGVWEQVGGVWEQVGGMNYH